ncbi:MAG: hypothetical protein AB3X44_11770 [Leptothrix sp. (in: b-proteobacteria)]
MRHPRHTTARVALLLVTSALLASCSGERPGASYFPLDAGHRWTYQLSSEWENNTTDKEMVVLSALGRESLESVGISGAAWHRRSESGVDYWLRSDETGVYRVASKSDVEMEPKADTPARYVLKAPIALGTSWQASTTAYLLKRRSEFPPEIRHSHPAVPMIYVIDALGLKVETQAGSFDGCLRVKGSGTVKLFADPVVGWQDMPLTTFEWYCPGVGLVKLERSEPANSTFLLGGTLKMELMSWQ